MPPQLDHTFVEGQLSTGTQNFSQLPNVPLANVTTWVVLLHGKGGQHTVWIDLPETILITREALDRGYAVVAMKSGGIGWDPLPHSAAHTNPDLVNYDELVLALAPVLSTLSPDHVGVGGSNGGNFLALLTQHVASHVASPPMSAAALFISNGWAFQLRYDIGYPTLIPGLAPGQFAAQWTGTGASRSGSALGQGSIIMQLTPYTYGIPLRPDVIVPPVFFVAGRQDTLNSDTVNNIPHFLQNLSADPSHTEEAMFRVNEPQPLYRSLFEKINGVNYFLSSDIYDSLFQVPSLTPFLDASGNMLYSVREDRDWLPITVTLPQAAGLMTGEIQSLLMEMYGDHALTAELFDFFSRHLP